MASIAEPVTGPQPTQVGRNIRQSCNVARFSKQFPRSDQEVCFVVVRPGNSKETARLDCALTASVKHDDGHCR